MKKILIIILSILGSIIAALLALILVCYINPGMSNRISQFLYKDKPVNEASNDISNEGLGSDSMPGGVGSFAEPVYPAEVDLNKAGLNPERIEKSYELVPLDSLSVDENLAKLTGYEPVSDEGEEISEKEKQKAIEELGYGNIGEGLDFDQEKYPYYHMLNDDLKGIYRQIFANANDLTKEFATVKNVSPDQLKYAFIAVVNDHPELFHVNTAYRYGFTRDGIAKMELSFNQTSTDIDSARDSFEMAAADLIAGLPSDRFDQEVALHDRLIDKVVYDLNAPMNQSAYSAMVSGATVCAGYARAFQYLCQKLDIPCYYCSGYAGENHAWNIIKLDDGYYNVDTTWDDTNPSTYDYFNLSDADIRKDHARKELSIYLPACNGEAHRKPFLESSMDQGNPVMNMPPVLRTLEETGFSKDDVITNLNDYFDNNYSVLSKLDGDNISYNMVISDDTLLNSIVNSYNTEGYKGAFMNRIMEERDIPACSFNIGIEELQGGYYLLHHELNR